MSTILGNESFISKELVVDNLECKLINGKAVPTDAFSQTIDEVLTNTPRSTENGMKVGKSGGTNINNGLVEIGGDLKINSSISNGTGGVGVTNITASGDIRALNFIQSGAGGKFSGDGSGLSGVPGTSPQTWDDTLQEQSPSPALVTTTRNIKVGSLTTAGTFTCDSTSQFTGKVTCDDFLQANKEAELKGGFSTEKSPGVYSEGAVGLLACFDRVNGRNCVWQVPNGDSLEGQDLILASGGNIRCQNLKNQDGSAIPGSGGRITVTDRIQGATCLLQNEAGDYGIITCGDVDARGKIDIAGRIDSGTSFGLNSFGTLNYTPDILFNTAPTFINNQAGSQTINTTTSARISFTFPPLTANNIVNQLVNLNSSLDFTKFCCMWFVTHEDYTYSNPNVPVPNLSFVDPNLYEGVSFQPANGANIQACTLIRAASPGNFIPVGYSTRFELFFSKIA